MKTLDGNGIAYELKDCTVVIKEPTEDEHAGKLTIGIKYKHNEYWYGNYIVADGDTEFFDLLLDLIALDKQKSELCGGSSVARTLREYFEEQRRYEAPTAEVK